MFRREDVKAWSAAASTLNHSFVDSSFKLNMCDRDLTYRWVECIHTSLFWSTQMSHPVNTGRRSNRQSDTVLMEQIWCDQYRNNQSAIALMFWQTNTNRYHLRVCVWEMTGDYCSVCLSGAILWVWICVWTELPLCCVDLLFHNISTIPVHVCVPC